MKNIFLKSIFLTMIIVATTANIFCGNLRNYNNNELLELIKQSRSNQSHKLVNQTEEKYKCGFALQAEIIKRWNTLSSSQKFEFKIAATPMECSKIYGNFRIHYDTSASSIHTSAMLDVFGQRIPNSWAQYIDSVGAIFNHVWNYEINVLGYDAPPFENGDSVYNVRVVNSYYYGMTYFVGAPYDGNRKYKTYIEIENDYQNFKTSGLNGLRVSAAHEFHHAIQIGSYGFWGEDLYAHEITSTWIEDLIYPNINDYLNYTPFYFNYYSDGRSFNTASYGGYELAIFAHYLAKKHGIAIMKEIWESMKANPFLQSVNDVLIVHGSNLQNAYAEFTKWNYYTAHRADTLNYYSEGHLYPQIKVFYKTNFNNNTVTINCSTQPFSSAYCSFNVDKDTITTMLSNINVIGAASYDTTKINISTSLSLGVKIPPYQQLQNNLTFRMFSDNPSMIKNYLSVNVLGGDSTQIQKYSNNASPNPYLLKAGYPLVLPIANETINTADVYMYNSAMQLIFKERFNTLIYNGNRAIVIPVNKLKSTLSSGVHFVIVKTTKNLFKWKVAVIK